PAELGCRHRGDLADQLVEDGSAEMVETVHRDDEGARTADDIVAIITLQIGFEGEDGQPVDDDARGHRRVARIGGGAPDIVGTIARDVDDATLAGKTAIGEQPRGVVEGAADRGAAAEQLTRCRCDHRGDGSGRGGVLDYHPVEHARLLAWSGPLKHRYRDRL